MENSELEHLRNKYSDLKFYKLQDHLRKCQNEIQLYLFKHQDINKQRLMTKSLQKLHSMTNKFQPFPDKQLWFQKIAEMDNPSSNSLIDSMNHYSMSKPQNIKVGENEQMNNHYSMQVVTTQNQRDINRLSQIDSSNVNRVLNEYEEYLIPYSKRLELEQKHIESNFVNIELNKFGQLEHHIDSLFEKEDFMDAFKFREQILQYHTQIREIIRHQDTLSQWTKKLQRFALKSKEQLVNKSKKILEYQRNVQASLISQSILEGGAGGAMKDYQAHISYRMSVRGDSVINVEEINRQESFYMNSQSDYNNNNNNMAVSPRDFHNMTISPRDVGLSKSNSGDNRLSSSVYQTDSRTVSHAVKTKYDQIQEILMSHNRLQFATESFPINGARCDTLFRLNKDYLLISGKNNAVEILMYRNLSHKATLYVEGNCLRCGLVSRDQVLILGCNKTIYAYQLDDFEEISQLKIKDLVTCMIPIDQETILISDNEAHLHIYSTKQYKILYTFQLSTYAAFTHQPDYYGILDFKFTFSDQQSNECVLASSKGLYFVNVNISNNNGRYQIEENKDEIYLKGKWIINVIEYQKDMYALCISEDVEYIQLLDRYRRQIFKKIKNPMGNKHSAQMMCIYTPDSTENESVPLLLVRDAKNITVVDINNQNSSVMVYSLLNNTEFSNNLMVNQWNEEKAALELTIIKYNKEDSIIQRYEFGMKKQ